MRLILSDRQLYWKITKGTLIQMVWKVPLTVVPRTRIADIVGSNPNASSVNIQQYL